MIDTAVAELAPSVGIAAACRALGRNRATHHRRHRLSPPPSQPAPVPQRERAQPQALSAAERRRVLDVLHSDRLADAASAQAWATLLDEGRYLCSEATMYRLLRGRGETRERRRQASHPPHVRPELVASTPNELYSWDITKLRGPARWTCYYLYVVLDVYSRYVVGWTVAAKESSALARQLLDYFVAASGVDPATLTIHADRGPSMASKPVAFLFADLGVTKTHSRARVSNDNPYSESQFETLKYCPDFPGWFGSLEDARAFCRRFFDAYNNSHRHSGLGLLTPATVHSVAPRRLTTAAPPSSTTPPAATPSDSARLRDRPDCPAPHGSTSPTAHNRPVSSFNERVSQTG